MVRQMGQFDSGTEHHPRQALRTSGRLISDRDRVRFTGWGPEFIAGWRRGSAGGS